MRVVKQSPKRFAWAVESAGKHCQFIRIPSDNQINFYTGILMADGAWIAWPQDLTKDEEALYLKIYGSPPNIFTLDKEKHEYLRVRTKEEDDGKTT